MWLRKLPGTLRSPSGLEWVLLRKLPWITLAGTLVAALLAVAARIFPPEGDSIAIARHVGMVDAYAIGLVMVHWTIVLTVAIGCVIVVVMKGPGYVADAYEVPDRDIPGR